MKAGTLLLLALIATAGGAQENLLDSNLYVEVAYRPEPFARYFGAPELERAAEDAGRALSASLARLELVAIRGVAGRTDFPRLRVSVGCNDSQIDCPCEIGVTFELVDEGRTLETSRPLTYAEPKEACIARAEVEPYRLAPELTAFLREEIVTVDGFRHLLDALAGLELGSKAIPDTRADPYRWLLPQTHFHRLLGHAPVFRIKGLLVVEGSKDVPLSCEATYGGRPIGGHWAGRWYAEVLGRQKTCHGPMKDLVAFEEVAASVHILSFALMPNRYDLGWTD